MAALVPDDDEYYDILLLGRTGMGKSTLGNKLLGLPQSASCRCTVGITQFVTNASDDPNDIKRFTQADDLEDPSKRCLSVTTQCKVLASEKPIRISEGDNKMLRILDVPGFADSSTMNRGQTIFEGNLSLIRNIIRVQMDLGLKFRRIIYFLPCRGALENADGVFQEELKVMYYYFGKSIFEYMVLAGTNPPTKRMQKDGMEFDTDDITTTEETFKTTVTLAIGDETLSCPPVVYIGHNYLGSKLVKDICSAPIHCARDSKGLQLEIQDNVCARCSSEYWIATVNGNYEEKRTGVADKEGESGLWCHPRFKSKYSKTAKFAGGMGHVVTLGMSHLVGKMVLGKAIWPGFTNSDEACALCKQSPGARGCIKVGQIVFINDDTTESGTKEIEVQHTNQLNN